MSHISLRQFLAQMGDDRAADLLGFKVRTVRAWRLGERKPSTDHARIIVQRSPVTWEGIYGSPDPRA